MIVKLADKIMLSSCLVRKREKPQIGEQKTNHTIDSTQNLIELNFQSSSALKSIRLS